jgi:dUTP pyrophosphatase
LIDIELKILDTRLTGWGFPYWGSEMAAGLDIFACVDAPLVVPPQAPALLIPSGFALHIGDPDWAALFYPRSGQGHRRGLVLGNTVGVVDADYQGQVMISVWNRNQTGDLVIEPGERIAQMVLTRVDRPRFHIVEEFGQATSRGAGGYGSTGSGPNKNSSSP